MDATCNDCGVLVGDYSVRCDPCSRLASRKPIPRGFAEDATRMKSGELMKKYAMSQSAVYINRRRLCISAPVKVVAAYFCACGSEIKSRRNGSNATMCVKCAANYRAKHRNARKMLCDICGCPSTAAKCTDCRNAERTRWTEQEF